MPVTSSCDVLHHFSLMSIIDSTIDWLFQYSGRNQKKEIQRNITNVFQMISIPLIE
jgi:hypothetical protein